MKMNVHVKQQQNFKGVQRATTLDLASALFMVGEEVMTESKRYYVPVKDGYLRDSGTTQAPQVMGNRVKVVLGFGGASAPYALKVHEAPNSWGQGKNKYLSKPLNRMRSSIPSRLAHHMRGRMGRRVTI